MPKERLAGERYPAEEAGDLELASPTQPVVIKHKAIKTQKNTVTKTLKLHPHSPLYVFRT